MEDIAVYPAGSWARVGMVSKALRSIKIGSRIGPHYLLKRHYIPARSASSSEGHEPITISESDSKEEDLKS